MSKKILIAGLGRHGKDTACEYLRDTYGLSFKDSSRAAAEIFIFDRLKDVDEGYISIDECYEDRHTGNNRKLWFDMICEYNKEDPTRLARKILESNDIYCGMRSIEELTACKAKGVFDVTVWIDAEERLGITEASSSITIKKEDCTFIIKNNGWEEDLYTSLDVLYNAAIKER